MLSCPVCRGEAAERNGKPGVVWGHTCGLTQAERRAHRVIEPHAGAGGSDRGPGDCFSGVLRPTAEQITALLGRASQALAQTEGAPSVAGPPASIPSVPFASGAAPTAADAPVVDATISRLSRLWDEWSDSQPREARAAEDAAGAQAGAGTTLDALLGPNRFIAPTAPLQRPLKHRKRRSSSGF
jgi:hypothetical protein